jgi:hypothetical protein
MNGNLSQTVVVGLRGWSGLTFLLTFAPGALALWAAVHGWREGQGIAGVLILAAGGLFLLGHAADSLARTIRPSRFRLDEDGFSLHTWRGTRRWTWGAYRGLWGLGHQLLKVEDDGGRTRSVAIGNWPRDLACRFEAYSSGYAQGDAEASQLRPSAAPLLLLSCALTAFALTVAWLSSGR